MREHTAPSCLLSSTTWLRRLRTNKWCKDHLRLPFLPLLNCNALVLFSPALRGWNSHHSHPALQLLSQPRIRFLQNYLPSCRNITLSFSFIHCLSEYPLLPLIPYKSSKAIQDKAAALWLPISLSILDLEPCLPQLSAQQRSLPLCFNKYLTNWCSGEVMLNVSKHLMSCGKTLLSVEILRTFATLLKARKCIQKGRERKKA